MKRTPSSSAAAVLGRGDLGRVDEQSDEHERDEVGRGVDVEDVRRADDGDQHAGERRPEEDRQAVRSLEERGRRRDVAVLLADELRDDRALHARGTAR